MADWWTYTLSDFLLFSPEAYYRLLELYNQAIWPAQLLSFALGVAILQRLRRSGPRRGRMVAAILAAAWLWVAWAFLFRRYATINWAATYFAIGFAIQAAFIFWAGFVRERLRFGPARRLPDRVGMAVFLYGLLVHPLVGPFLGRDWKQMEVFGVAPDPTVLATLGLVLLAMNRAPWGLLLIPALWCAVSGATLWTMKSPDALVLPLAALLVLAVAAGKVRALPRQSGKKPP